MTGADEDFAEVARASYGGLRHAAYLLTGDRHVAEDAAQTALVRTYAAWSRVRRDDAYAYARRDAEFFDAMRQLGNAAEPFETDIEVVNQAFRMGGDHLFAWDFAVMKRRLEAVHL